MEYILIVIIISIILFQLVKMQNLEKPSEVINIEPVQKQTQESEQFEEEVTVTYVTFEGYPTKHLCDVSSIAATKGDYVLLLTNDGIRCAMIVEEPKSVSLNNLQYPPYLLHSAICTADASDVQYYNRCVATK